MKINNLVNVLIISISLNSSFVYATDNFEENLYDNNLPTTTRISPKKVWHFTGIEDLGAGETKLCNNCHIAHVRYLHQMTDEDGNDLEVGYVCAGKLESQNDDPESVKKAVSIAKNRTRKYK